MKAVTGTFCKHVCSFAFRWFTFERVNVNVSQLLTGQHAGLVTRRGVACCDACSRFSQVCVTVEKRSGIQCPVNSRRVFHK